MKKVLIAVPNEGHIDTQVVKALLDIRWGKEYQKSIILPMMDMPIENSRAHTINYFLKGDWDYLFSMDADNPPLADPLELIELDLDLVGYPTPIWCWNREKNKGPYPIEWNVYDYNFEEGPNRHKQHEPREGLQEVDAIGSGAFLVSRRVLEHPSVRYQPFQRKWNDDGTVLLGSDLTFCQKVKKAGFKIHAHFGHICLHYKQVELTAVIDGWNSFYQRKKNKWEEELARKSHNKFLVESQV